jgi:hypothetical protein
MTPVHASIAILTSLDSIFDRATMSVRYCLMDELDNSLITKYALVARMFQMKIGLFI